MNSICISLYALFFLLTLVSRAQQVLSAAGMEVPGAGGCRKWTQRLPFLQGTAGRATALGHKPDSRALGRHGVHFQLPLRNTWSSGEDFFFFLTPSCLDDVSEENCTGQKQGLSSLLCIKPFSSGNNNSNALFLHNLPEFIHKILLRTSVYFIYINLGLLHLSRQMLFPRIRRKKKN